jgi:hypothetical protein
MGKDLPSSVNPIPLLTEYRMGWSRLDCQHGPMADPVGAVIVNYHFWINIQNEMKNGTLDQTKIPIKKSLPKSGKLFLGKRSGSG